LHERRIPLEKESAMAGPQGRTPPRIGPSDTSDTSSDRPNQGEVDTDDGGTGERVTAGKDPHSELHDERGPDRVVEPGEAGLGGGLDQAEEAQLGVTDEELARRQRLRKQKR
jgi:hypothetical protein